MKKRFKAIIYLIFLCQFLYSQEIQWEKSFGGTENEYSFGCNVLEVPTGGYIVTGTSASTDGDIGAIYGNKDFWVAKLTEDGTIEWKEVYGGFGNDSFFSFISPTIEGGYIFAGTSRSNDGTISGNNGGHDIWVAKLTSEGAIEWEDNYGGSEDEYVYSIFEADGGYIVSGTSKSSDIDVGGNNGGTDYWLLKLSIQGEIEWENNYGGSGDDTYPFLEITNDGGYILSGVSDSHDGDVSNNYGFRDVWLIKLSNQGEIEWENNYGGSGTEATSFVKQTNDGGYILASNSNSVDGDITENKGNFDLWVAKLSNEGEIEWENNYGGSGYEYQFGAIQQTNDGGYILTSNSDSHDGDVSGNHGGNDYWLVKLSINGEIEWEKSYGGSSIEEMFSLYPQTSDGGFILSGVSRSNDGDVSNNYGGSDFWVIKVKPYISSIPNYLSAERIDLYPNPSNEVLRIKNNNLALGSKIEIYNSIGKLVKKGELINNEIEIASLEIGVYSIVIRFNERIYFSKFVKY